MERRQYQFELWSECNSKCKFCYLGKSNGFTPDSKKLENINKTLEIISDENLYKEINCLAYIGGEFFQGQMKNPEVKSGFLKLMKKSNEFLERGLIDQVWICATLTIGDQRDLFDSLECFSDTSKVWILTSYDTVGRFHTEKMFHDWENNLDTIREKYPDIKINITSILTGDFIDKYLSGSLRLMDVVYKHGCSLFLKPPCPVEHEGGFYSKQETNQIIPNFFPTRKKFIEFLSKYKGVESDASYEKLFNMKLRSDYLFKFRDDGLAKLHRIKEKSQEVTEFGSINNITMPCGHSNQYAIYIDDDDHCAICDKIRIANMR